MKKNFYGILGVSSDSEDVVITAAYKALMRKYHPDKNTNADATLKAGEINEAYAVLSDPIKRRTYDRANGFFNPGNSQHEQAENSTQSTDDFGTTQTSEKKIEAAPSNLKWLVQFGVFGAVLVGVATVIDGSRSPDTSYSTEAASDGIDATERAADFLENQSSPPIAEDTSEIETSFDLVGATGLPNQSEKTLGPQPPLSFTDIETAVAEFDRVLARRGMMGAKAYSIDCHKAAETIVEWPKYDFCVAFDLAASELDKVINGKDGTPPNAYFSFISDNLSSQYGGAPFMAYTVNQRVSSIQRAVRPALLETISARLAKNSPDVDPKPEVGSADPVKQ